MWLPRLMVFAISLRLTQLVMILILGGDRWGTDGALFLPSRPAIATEYTVGLAALYYWYRRKRCDLPALGCGVFSLCAVVASLMVEADLFLHKDAESLLFWGLPIAGLTELCGKLFLYWQRAMETEEKAGAAPGADGEAQPARHRFLASRQGIDWPGLQDGLVRRGLWLREKDFPEPPPSGPPLVHQHHAQCRRMDIRPAVHGVSGLSAVFHLEHRPRF